MGMPLHGDDNRANLCICTNMDGGLVMNDLTPEEMAEYVHASGDLIFNPYPSGSLNMKLFIDELLRLTTESNNAKV